MGGGEGLKFRRLIKLKCQRGMVNDRDFLARAFVPQRRADHRDQSERNPCEKDPFSASVN